MTYRQLKIHLGYGPWFALGVGIDPEGFFLILPMLQLNVTIVRKPYVPTIPQEDDAQ